MKGFIELKNSKGFNSVIKTESVIGFQQAIEEGTQTDIFLCSGQIVHAKISLEEFKEILSKHLSI